MSVIFQRTKLVKVNYSHSLVVVVQLKDSFIMTLWIDPGGTGGGAARPLPSDCRLGSPVAEMQPLLTFLPACRPQMRLSWTLWTSGNLGIASGAFVFASSSVLLWLWDFLATWIRLSFVGKSPLDRSTSKQPRGTLAFKIPSLNLPGLEKTTNSWPRT